MSSVMAWAEMQAVLHAPDWDMEWEEEVAATDLAMSLHIVYQFCPPLLQGESK
jgi:hypothetical protein